MLVRGYSDCPQTSSRPAALYVARKRSQESSSSDGASIRWPSTIATRGIRPAYLTIRVARNHPNRAIPGSGHPSYVCGPTSGVVPQYLGGVDIIVRIDFEERDQQWILTLFDQEGTAHPGEPFPAFGGEGYSRLEQVLNRINELGFVPTRVPYNRPNASRYIVEVKPK